jgi:effector-binding domain-containing protein
MSSGLIRFAVASLIAIGGAAISSGSFGQENPAIQAPAAPSTAPAAPPTASPPSATTPAPAAPEAAQPGEPAPQAGEGSTGETVDLPARPFAFIEGKADRDEIFSAILGSLGLVKRDMDKANLTPAGRPLAVFVESDDTGFKYHAGYPLASVPEGRTSLSDAVKIAETPSGKAMRFEHQGAYSDIDATYDAITAYLDEKGVDAQDSFIEEYANDIKDPDDPTLQVNIYVLLK